MTARLPLLVSNGWDEPLRALQAAQPDLEIITVTGSDDLRSASEQIARALLSGRQVRQRLVIADDEWLQRAMDAGGSVFAQTVGTLKGKSDEWLDNILDGGRALAVRPSVAPLAGRFVGARAVVFGAGPSLDRVAPSLPKLCDNAITIAAGSALLPLQRLGVTPDIACVIEGRDRSEQWASPVDLAKTVLVLAQHGHPAHWRAPARLLVRADLAENAWFTRLTADGVALASGGNVGAFAVVLAAHLGCQEIVLAGLDFSQPHGADHARGATSPGFGASAGESFEVVGVGGTAVPSSALLISYRTNLEGIVNALRSQTTVINVAGRGAARIAGTTEADASALPPAQPSFDAVVADTIEARLTAAPALPDSALKAEIESLEQEWTTLATLAERLVAEQAEAHQWRAAFGSVLAGSPGSWGGILLAGFVLDLNADPSVVVQERLSKGRDWLECYRRRLGL